MHDRCLVIVASNDKSYIFMNKNRELQHAIDARGYKNALNHNRLGGRRLFAYDETSRVLTVCHGQDVGTFLLTVRFKLTFTVTGAHSHLVYI